MNKLKKNIITVLLAIALFATVFPFAACGGEVNPDGPGPGGNKGGDEYWVERIEVTKGAGFQEDYMDGETFNKSGLTVKAYWNDGYVEDNVPSTNYHVVPSIITEDVETVTVFYGDASYELTISSAHVVGIDVERLPTIVNYYQGEVFDPIGMILCYVLDNGSTRAIKNFDASDVEFDLKPFAYGDDSISVNYGGYACDVPITVKGTGFKIEVNNSKNCVMSGPGNYKAGTNATIKSLASNNDFMQDFSVGSVMTFKFESETPQINFLFQGASTYVSKYGTGGDSNYPVIVEDMQVSRVFDMTVNGIEIPISDDAILKGIASEDGETAHVEYLANWTEVNLGILDVYTDQMNTVVLTFKDNGYKNATALGPGLGKMPAPYIDYLMVSYLPDETVDRIEVTSPQNKTTYIAGQSFDPTGMVVTAFYVAGGSGVVSDYKINPSGALTKAGKNYVIIGYLGHSTTIEVIVTERVMTGIEITNPPAVTMYGVGQMFDPTGMVVSAIYNDGSTEVINNYDYTPNEPLTMSDTTVTVTLDEFSDTCTISITDEDLLKSLSVSGMPTSELAEGDTLPTVNPSSITVYAEYYSGIRNALDPSEYTLSIDTGVAKIGSGVTATLKSDTSAKATALFKVSKTIDTKKANIITNDTATTYYRNDKPAWRNGAVEDDFIQKSKNGVTIRYTFESVTAATATLTLSGSSGWVTKYEGGTPKEKGDMQANVMFDLYVNGVLVPMANSVIFRGGVYDTARNENLVDWHLIDLANVLLAEGTNTVELVFKAFTYSNANASEANPYIDYFMLSTVNSD